MKQDINDPDYDDDRDFNGRGCLYGLAIIAAFWLIVAGLVYWRWV